MHINDLSDFVKPTFWNESLASLESDLDPQIFAAYIKPLKPKHFDKESGELVIYAPSMFVCRHLNDNFKERLSSALAQQLGVEELRVTFAVDQTAPEKQETPKTSYVVVKKAPLETDAVAVNLQSAGSSTIGTATISKTTAGTSAAPQLRSKSAQAQSASASLAVAAFNAEDNRINSGINPKYTFANFVVGNNNQFCHAAAQSVAEAPGQRYNPLFIYGGVGLGKTHLLHAIGNAILDKDPSKRVLYMSSEAFTNDLIQALRLGKMDAFKNRLRTIDLLLIDDIQFMCGKERTQEEFFHTFNALYSAKNQIIITSDKIPQEIPGIEERLRTRFAWGLIADLQAPDFETRVAILKKKALQENFMLPEDAANYIGENVVSNVRELEGALTRLHAISTINNVSITKDLAKSALTHLLQTKAVPINIDDIKGAVAAHFNIKISDMVSKRRTRNLSFPRHIAMFLCRKHTTASYPEIGSQFGGRDHSSVIHAANVVANKLGDDEALMKIIKDIEKRLLTPA